MAVDVLEDDGSYQVKAELPGFSKDEIEVSLEDGQLTIQAEHKVEDENADQNYVYRETRSSSMRRSFAVDPDKIEADKMELQPSLVPIKGLLESSLVMIKEKAYKHGISLDLHIPDALAGLKILGDERRLKQIVFNLLSNAAKFTPDGGTITVEAKKEGEELLVSVSDTGIGIEPEDQERIFGAFEQVDSSYARHQQGTGLGLALTKRLVALHGGRIWVESAGEGKGSTFTFAIPAQTG